MQFEDIIYEKKEGVAEITINREKKLNCFRTKTILEMKDAFLDAEDDGKIGVVVLKGAGEKAFCVGGDIEEMKGLNKITGNKFLQNFFELLRLIRKIQKPVIAAVQGYCLGGGNEINVTCDLTLATENSKFGQVGPKVGSVPVLGATQIMPKLVGEKKAREIIFLCKQYSAQEAEQMGWINKVVKKEDFEKELNDWTSTILSHSPQSIKVAKLSLNYTLDSFLSSYYNGIEILSLLYETEEFKEGMNAFMEKRKPDFNKFRK
jgi:dihydroxynaphthoic acid synthetase